MAHKITLLFHDIYWFFRVLLRYDPKPVLAPHLRKSFNDLYTPKDADET